MTTDIVRDDAPLRICLVAHLAYGALSGTGGHIGGVEHQTTRLARWLAARGHSVSLITWDEGQVDGSTIDGVTVWKVCRLHDGWPGIRFIHPRWSSLVGALGRADAEVYYHNSAEYVTGQIAMWCRIHGRKFVYSSASNADCDRRLPFLRSRHERLLYRAGLRRATARIVQTSEQQRMMRTSFGLSSELIPMPGIDLSTRGARVPAADARGTVLWIGRVCEVKRPDRLLALAAACPELQFELIGPSDGSPYTQEVLHRAAGIGNLVLRGALSRERVADALARAWCLCCTSEIEGFPNTFLEAWSHSVPVISTFDPDGVIARHQLGWSVPDVSAMASRLRALLSDPAAHEAAAGNARRYYRDTHTEEAVLPRFEALFMRAVRGSA